MTNAQIIAEAKFANGITEEAHTFAHWKKLGYFVRKGEKAAFSTRIWKYAGKKVEGENGEEDEQNMKMFMKKAHFFTRSQVEKAI